MVIFIELVQYAKNVGGKYLFLAMEKYLQLKYILFSFLNLVKHQILKNDKKI